ncbi:MAG: transporter [Mycobacterium sp.]|nr:transporter [Mycobacterium sp.]
MTSVDTAVRRDAPPGVAPAAPRTTGTRVPVRLSLLALALGGFGIGTTEFATMGVLPNVAGDLSVSIPAAGHLVSAYALGVVVGAPLFAVLTARVPRKALLLGLLAAFTLFNGASAVAPGYGWLFAARFASGLPHGAFFGIGAIVAASLVPPERRSRAISMMMLGLTVANIAGVPLSTLLGQHLGWRSTYATVAVIGVLALAAVARLVPRLAALAGAGPRQELGALRRPQVWLTLLVGAVGFGGFFAVYSYISPTLQTLAGYPAAGVPVVLALFGVGMTLGTLVGGRLADWSLPKSIWIGLGCVTTTLLTFPLAAHQPVPAALWVFLLGGSGSLMLPGLQTRLIDVAGHAQSLGAALNHSALNCANALGAFLGGLVLEAGFGYTSPAVVGAGLGAAGLFVFSVSRWVDRRAAAGLTG